ncbi:MAG TPA: glycoside hydrolase family 15 protein [Sphingobacteriaceae bacterium]
MDAEPVISDYGLIGNCRSAALVSKYGSVDWCCLPDFHSPALFCSLLDRRQGGFFSIAPAGGFSSHQAYIPDTNVLVTTFETPDGTATLTDAFAVAAEEDKKGSLFPDHEVLRIVQTIRGTVRFRIRYRPRPDYGKSSPVLKDRGKLGIYFSFRELTVVLLSTYDGLCLEKDYANGEFLLKEGDLQVFSLSGSCTAPAIIPEVSVTARLRMDRTIRYWKDWITRCRYAGPWQTEVRRSALTLKLLTYAPSGAIIAAPTTSLPEDPGGRRNWDYRYCWLRDASFTVRALLALGFQGEADAYMSWILHATRLTRPRLQILYSVFGRTDLAEKELPWLSGYLDSRPVRIGNGASAQVQLDVYGEVLDAIYVYSRHVTAFDRSSRKFILQLGKVLCRYWDQPDEGLWEVRSGPAQHTHSKVMSWVGLDRLIKMADRYGWRDAPVGEYRMVRHLIEAQIESRGFHRGINAYVSELDGQALDASALVFPLVGYCQADSARMAATRTALERLTRNRLLYRYNPSGDGLKGGEGSFGICNFWMAENLALAGEVEAAMKYFRYLLRYASPTGLFPEEMDPDTGALLGNYPQGFTHIGLINAAIAIETAREGGEAA